MIPSTDVNEYREFTHKHVMTTFAGILMTAAITQFVQGFIIPLTSAYLQGWVIPILEILVAGYILYHTNKSSKAKLEPKLAAPALPGQPNKEPSINVEEILMPIGKKE